MTQADIEDFVKRQLWTIAQAAFLINGEKPPEPLSLVDVRSFGGEVDRAYEELKSAVEMVKFKSYPPRRVGGWIGESRAEPADIVEWARRFGFQVPSELAGLSRPVAGNAASKDWQLEACKVAEAFFYKEKASGRHCSVSVLAEHVAKVFRERDIKGPHGPLSPATIKRHALTGVTKRLSEEFREPKKYKRKPV